MELQQQRLELFRSISPAEFYIKFLAHNVRPDGRSLNTIRKASISVGSITSALGSAFVKIGHSSVVAGIKAEVGKPSSSNFHPIITAVELTPLCSSQFRPGKPPEQAHVINEVLRGIITSSQFISINELWIVKDVLIWHLFVDIYCLNHDGNILDACVIALLSALRDLRLPIAKLSEDKSDVVVPHPNHRPVQLNILHYPIPLTFALIEDYIVIDPTLEEENLQSSSVTIVYTSQGKICSILKPGGSPLSIENMKICLEHAKKRAVEVTKLIEAGEHGSVTKN